VPAQPREIDGAFHQRLCHLGMVERTFEYKSIEELPWFPEFTAQFII